MSLTGLAIGQVSLKIRKKIADKTGHTEQYWNAKERFAKYKKLNAALWCPGVAWVLTVPLEIAVKVIERKQEKERAKLEQEQRKFEEERRLKELQKKKKAEQDKENKMYESEKELTDACVELIKNATAYERFDIKYDTINEKARHELMALNGLNSDSLETIFGKEARLSILKGKSNVIIAHFPDYHVEFFAKDPKTGNFIELANLCSDKSIKMLNQAFETMTKKHEDMDKAKKLQALNQLASQKD